MDCVSDFGIGKPRSNSGRDCYIHIGANTFEGSYESVDYLPHHHQQDRLDCIALSANRPRRKTLGFDQSGKSGRRDPNAVLLQMSHICVPSDCRSGKERVAVAQRKPSQPAQGSQLCLIGSSPILDLKKKKKNEHGFFSISVFSFFLSIS